MAKVSRRKPRLDYGELRRQGYSEQHARETARRWKQNERPSAADEAVEAVRELEEYEWTDEKDPTATMFPERPRSNRATYDELHQLLNIEWARPGKLGPSTTYENVTRQQWEYLKNRAPSTGRYVNNVLNYHEYYYPE